jgi:uncharacterized membrane protein/uncharacterized integral membrane protein
MTDALAPSRRCDWVDQLRGWAVLVMIEVHCVNTWLELKLRPEWLNYLNGLVAPSFLMCAGFSLVLSTFRADGTLRPFKDSAKRYAFILACAYLLHAPGFTLAEWTVLNTAQKGRELFKIDVLQCTVYSLLILQGLARALRSPRVFTPVAGLLAGYVALVAPYLWATGVGDGLWLPIRGLLNGHVDRGVQALFPLFPWLAFVAFGAFLGGIYRWARVEVVASGPEARARMSEPRLLAGLFALGLVLMVLGWRFKESWLWGGTWQQFPDGGWRLVGRFGSWSWNELQALHNTTLPSIAERLGWICMGGALLGFVELKRPRLPGPNPFQAAARESLLLYMLHLNLIFGLLMQANVVAFTGWDWNTQGWPMALALTAAVAGTSLAAGVAWERVRETPERMRRLQRAGVAVLALWFLVGGWWTFRHYLQSPELAREPYPFLNAARARKGLPPTPDGLTRDPEEYFREAARRKVRVNEAARAKIAEAIRARKP